MKNRKIFKHEFYKIEPSRAKILWQYVIIQLAEDMARKANSEVARQERKRAAEYVLLQRNKEDFEEVLMYSDLAHLKPILKQMATIALLSC